MTISCRRRRLRPGLRSLSEKNGNVLKDSSERSDSGGDDKDDEDDKDEDKNDDKENDEQLLNAQAEYSHFQNLS